MFIDRHYLYRPSSVRSDICARTDVAPDGAWARNACKAINIALLRSGGTLTCVDPNSHRSCVSRGLLRENLLHDVSLDIGQPEIPSLEFESQPRVVNAQAMQDGRVQIVGVNRIARDVV